MKTLKSIAQAVIVSKILYTVELWGGCQLYLRNRIQTIMMKAVRIVLGKGSGRLSTSTILRLLGWQGVDQLIATYSLRLAVTTVVTGTPTNLNARINRIPARETRSRTRGDRILPSWHSGKGKQSFTYRAVKSLNNISNDVFMIKNKTARGKAIKKMINETVSPYCVKDPVSSIQLTTPTQYPAPPPPLHTALSTNDDPRVPDSDHHQAASSGSSHSPGLSHTSTVSHTHTGTPRYSAAATTRDTG